MDARCWSSNVSVEVGQEGAAKAVPLVITVMQVVVVVEVR